MIPETVTSCLLLEFPSQQISMLGKKIQIVSFLHSQVIYNAHKVHKLTRLLRLPNTPPSHYACDGSWKVSN